MGWPRGMAVNEIVRCVTRPGVGLRWGFSGGLVPCGGVRRPFSRICDTPVDALFSNGSRVVREGPGCVEPVCAVSLSFAAAQRVVPRSGFRKVGEWWWFENSRAYLYYFFIVNDCQSIVRFSCVGSGREACEGRWGFRAMRLSL